MRENSWRMCEKTVPGQMLVLASEKYAFGLIDGNLIEWRWKVHTTRTAVRAHSHTHTQAQCVTRHNC